MTPPSNPVDDNLYDYDFESDSESESESPTPTNGQQDDVVIAVMGSTGSGKSSFIQLMTGNTDVKVGNELESETSDVQVVPFLDPTTRRKIIVVDTPGFDDSRAGVSDTDILKKITDFLVNEYDKDRKLNGLIYVQRISDPRFGGQSLRNLRMFRGLCGADNFKNVIVLTTFWDRVDNEEGLAREGQLKTKIFKDFVAGGAHFMRHDRAVGVDSAHKVLGQILPLPPTTVQIQKEICEEKKTLEDTTAGSVRREEVDRLIAKHKEEVASIRAEMEAVKESNKEAMKELVEERTKLQKELARWQVERSDLQRGLEIEKRSRQQLEEEAKREKENNVKWRLEQERKLAAQLDSQAKAHDAELTGMQAKLAQEQKDRAKKELEDQARLKKEAERWEAERVKLQRGLEGEKKSREQLEEEARKETERHRVWHQDQKHKFSAQLDFQEKTHSTHLTSMQAKLDQERARKESEDPVKLQKESERWEAERLKLRNDLEGEKKYREQLEEAKKEKEWREELWRREQERKMSAQLEFQAKAHSAELMAMKARLDQEHKNRAIQDNRRSDELMRLAAEERRQREAAERQLNAERNKSFAQMGRTLARDIPLIPTWMAKIPLVATGSVLDVVKSVTH